MVPVLYLGKVPYLSLVPNYDLVFLAYTLDLQLTERRCPHFSKIEVSSIEQQCMSLFVSRFHDFKVSRFQGFKVSRYCILSDFGVCLEETLICHLKARDSDKQK